MGGVVGGKRADLLVIGEKPTLLQEIAVRVQVLSHDVIVHAIAAVQVEHLVPGGLVVAACLHARLVPVIQYCLCLL